MSGTAETGAAGAAGWKRRPYNYEHFRPGDIVAELTTAWRWPAVAPGAVVPDFTLPAASGASVHLADLRGRPVLVHFGSYT